MAQRGGKRPGSGRPKGSVDRATSEAKGTIEELARSHTETAINALVHVATSSESDAARVSAASVILDRGYGKARQSVDANVSGGLTVTITGADAALL
jgi:hypothetical protein